MLLRKNMSLNPCLLHCLPEENKTWISVLIINKLGTYSCGRLLNTQFVITVGLSLRPKRSKTHKLKGWCIYGKQNPALIEVRVSQGCGVRGGGVLLFIVHSSYKFHMNAWTHRHPKQTIQTNKLTVPTAPKTWINTVKLTKRVLKQTRGKPNIYYFHSTLCLCTFVKKRIRIYCFVLFNQY